MRQQKNRKMSMQSKTLLADMTARTNTIIQTVEAKFVPLTVEQLNKKPSAESWSILECLAHLNNYGDYYLVQIEDKMKASNHVKSSTFTSGWLGNYFANTMIVKEGKIKKMSSPKEMNPAIGATTSTLDKTVIREFLDQQKRLLKLLEAAQNSNLTKIKIPITLTTLLKIRLGDTFRFVIFHNERHVLQAGKVVK